MNSKILRLSSFLGRGEKEARSEKTAQIWHFPQSRQERGTDQPGKGLDRKNQVRVNVGNLLFIRDVDTDLHESALWETSWIRIRLEDADPDPGIKKSPKNVPKGTENLT